MNPVVFALRHPITVMVAMIGIVVGSGLAVSRMKIDIFPQLNLPVIYVCQPYSGMDPGQMEGLLTNYYEYHFLYINGIHHVESKNIQGLALMKLFPSGHGHGPGDGRGDPVRQPLARLHAAGYGRAVRDAL
jgi:multidrug efflux pump subunit AcrB